MSASDDAERARATGDPDDAPSVGVTALDGPSVDVPAVDVPDPAAAPRELRLTFWSLVLQFNLALLGLALGVLLVAVRGEWRWGGAAFLVGLFALVRGYRGYRRARFGDGEDED